MGRVMTEFDYDRIPVGYYAGKARRVLGWKPARGDIEGIVRDAWNFEQRRAP